MPVNKVRIDVCGCTYVISSPEQEDYVLSLASKLDKDMAAFMAQNANASVTTAAIMCALEYLDEHTKDGQGADNMRDQIKSYLEDAAKARFEVEDAKREVDRLRREVTYLRDKLER